MDGWWDADDLDGFLFRLLDTRLDERVGGFEDAWLHVKSRFLNLQRGQRAYVIGEHHYDLGNDLFQAMLGKRLVYSCGYWKDATDLDAAQEAKLDLIFRKLGLKARHARARHRLRLGRGTETRRGTLRRIRRRRHRLAGAGRLRARICTRLAGEIRLADYRTLDERFDRVFSIGMFEHVGVKNYKTYFDVALRCTAEDGLFVLHTIGSNVSSNHTDPWIAKYIFPNSMLPSAEQIANATEGVFVTEDWHNFGADYDRTLMAWRANFERGLAARWPRTLWRALPPHVALLSVRRRPRYSARVAISSGSSCFRRAACRGGYRAPR